MTVSAPLIHSIGLRSPMVKPSDVGVRASPHTPTSYGASGSSRIFEKTDGRRPNACTATARSRTNVPPSTIIATRWRRHLTSLAGSVGSMAVSVVPAPGDARGSAAWLTGHDRPRPRLLGHPAELGELDHPLRGEGLPGHRTRATPASRSRSRRCARTRRSSWTSPCPRSSRRSRRSSSELDSPPIIMGHSAGGAFTQILLDHGFGAAGRRAELCADRGRPGRAAFAGEVDLPGAEEPGQPAQGGRSDVRAVDVRVHQHLLRGRVARRCTSATTSRPTAASCGAACWPTSSPARRRPGSTTTTTTGRRCCSSPAARTTSCRRRSSSRT